MEALILAGGKGVRLRPLTDVVPKPLVPIDGRSVMEHQINNLRNSDIHDLILVIGHLGNQIEAYFGSGARWGMRIRYFHEQSPLGTAGALPYLLRCLTSDVLVLYGDLLLDMDFRRFAAFHRSHEGLISLVAHPNDHPTDSDLLEIADDNVVTRIIKKKEDRGFTFKNCVNAGVFILDRRAIAPLTPGNVYDIEQDLIAPAMGNREVYAYRTTEYIKDVGTPPRLKQAASDLASGVVAARNISRPQRAIFLDRDGTINHEVGLVTQPEQLRIDERSYQAVRLINQSGFLAIVITNQSVVARNLCSIADVERIHDRLTAMLGLQGAYVDDIYYCPHHPDSGYPGENQEFKVICDCRKPNIGLLQRAAHYHNINLRASIFIGDTTTDMQTGINAGLKTILVATGFAGRDHRYDVEPDHRAGDLLSAVEFALTSARPITGAW